MPEGILSTPSLVDLLQHDRLHKLALRKRERERERQGERERQREEEVRACLHKLTLVQLTLEGGLACRGDINLRIPIKRYAILVCEDDCEQGTLSLGGRTVVWLPKKRRIGPSQA